METSLKEKIISILSEKGPISIAEISRILEANKEYLSGYLHGLADSGILKSKKVGRAKIFIVNSANNEI